MTASTCGACTAQIGSSDARFCPRCGARLAASAEVPTQPTAGDGPRVGRDVEPIAHGPIDRPVRRRGRRTLAVSGLLAVLVVAGAGARLVERAQPAPEPAEEQVDPLGSIRWSTLGSPGPSHPVGGTVATTGDVLAVNANGTLYALDAPTGTVRWTRQVPGDTWSEVIAGDGVVLTQSARWIGGESHQLEAFDADDGRRLWSSSSPGWSGGVTIRGSTVFVSRHDTAGSPQLAALDVRDGSERWRVEAPHQVIADGGGVVVAAEWAAPDDGIASWVLHVVDTSTGARRWETTAPEHPGSSASLQAAVVGDVVLVGGVDGGLRAHDLADGTILWERAEVRREAAFLPLEDGIVVATPDRRLALVESRDGRERWRSERSVLANAQPVAVSGAVLTRSGGALAAFDTDDGGVLWEARGVPASPFNVAGDLVVGTEAGRRIVALEVDSGARAWTSELPGGVMVGLTTSEHGVHRTSSDSARIVTYDHDDGTHRWHRRLDGWTTAPLVAAGDLALVTYHVHREGPEGTEVAAQVEAFDAAEGDLRWRLRTGAGMHHLTPLGMAAADGTLLAASGPTLTAIDLDRGGPGAELELSAPVVGPPAVSAGTGAVATDDGALHVVDTVTGAIAGVVHLEAPAVAAPTVTSDGWALVITEEAALVAVDLDDQRVVWERPLGFVSAYRPLIVGDVVVVTAGQDLLAVDLDSGQRRWTHRSGSSLTGAPVASDAGVHLATTAGDVLVLDPQDGSVRSVFITPRRLSAGPVVAEGNTYVVDVSGALVALGPRPASAPTPPAPRIDRG